MKNISTVMMLVALGLISGCVSMKETPDGKYISSTTVKDTWDRSITYAQLLEKDENGNFVEKAGSLHVGSTVEGDTIKGLIPAAGSAAVMGHFNVVASKARSNCGGGGCPTAGNTFVTAIAESAADSAAETIVESAVNVGAGCGTACAKP